MRISDWSSDVCSSDLVFTTEAKAGCTDAAHDRVIADYLEKRPVSGLGIAFDSAEAECLQRRLVDALSGRFGPPVGYKVGLTSQAAQAALGTSRPVRGDRKGVVKGKGV